MSKLDKLVVQTQKCKTDRIYITLGYNFGFSLFLYEVEKKLININPAAIVLLAYYKQEYARTQLQKNIEVTINPGNTLFSFVSTSSTFLSSLDILFEVIDFVPKENFQQIKTEFIQQYKSSYVKNQTSLNLTLLEFIAQNKRFNKDEFNRFIEELSKEDVELAQKYLFKGMEFCVHALGEINESVESKMRKKIVDFDNESYTKSVFIPLSSRDIIPQKLLYKSKTLSRFLLIHTNPDHINRLEDILFTYQLLNEIFSKNLPQIIIDSADMGMILPNISLIMIKNYLNKEDISNYIGKVKEQFIYLLTQKPKLFSEMFVILWLSGINYIHYYEMLESKSVEEYQKVIEIVLGNSTFCSVERGE